MLVLAACAPGARWVAVAGGPGSQLLVFSANLDVAQAATVSFTPQDTLTALTFAGDGQSLYVAAVDGAGGVLVRVGRGGGAETRVSLPVTRPQFVHLAPRATAILLGTVATGTPSGAGTLRIARPRDLAIADSVGVCVGAPVGIAVHPDGDRAYIACEGDEVVEVDLRLRTAIRRATPAPASGCQLRGPALSANGTVLYVSCAATGQLLLLDRVTLTPFDAMPVGRGIGAPVVLRRRLLLPRAEADELVIVDPRGRQVVARLAAPHPLVIAGVGARAYVLTRARAPELLTIDVDAAVIRNRTRLPFPATRLAVWPTATPVMRW